MVGHGLIWYKSVSFFYAFEFLILAHNLLKKDIFYFLGSHIDSYSIGDQINNFQEELIKDTIESIENSPQKLKKQGKNLNLPDKINVIIAKESPSSYLGILIKHPNQEDFAILLISWFSIKSRSWQDSFTGFLDNVSFNNGKVSWKTPNFRNYRKWQAILNWVLRCRESR